MAKIRGLYQRGNIYWTCVRDVRESTGETSQRKAEAVLLQRRMEARQGRYQGPRKDYKFKELAQEYLVWAEGRYNTLRDRKSRIAQLLSVFGNLPLGAVNTRRIEKYQSERLTHVGPAGVNRAIGLLKHMFTKAVDWQMVSPYVRESFAKVKQLQEPAGRTRFLSVEEYYRLVNASPSHLKPIIIFAVHTGARWSEIRLAEWPQVDFEHGYVYLKKTKTGKGRGIPMNETLRATLEAIPHTADSRYVFANRSGDPYGSVRKAFNSAKERAKILDLKFHDLRHTTASWMREEGQDLADVQELLGHSRIEMTLRYAHLGPTYKKRAVGSLDQRLKERPEQVVKP